MSSKKQLTAYYFSFPFEPKLLQPLQVAAQLTRECPTVQCFPTKRSYVNKSCFNLSKILIEKVIKQKACTIKAGLFLFLK